MQTVITMAGLGSRFKEAGYDMPKFEIQAHGKSLFAWSMESLEGFYNPGDTYYFIVRAEDDAGDFIKNEWKAMDRDTDEIKIIELSEPTDGQATTAMKAAPFWDRTDALLIYNIDTYVKSGCMKSSDIEGDGFIPCFNAPGDHWSFVSVDETGKATEVREKQRISDNCTLGAYYFSSCALYEKMYESYYKDAGNLEKGEKYVAPLYNHMIRLGMTVRMSIVPFECVHVLGTPAELKEFEKLPLDAI